MSWLTEGVSNFNKGVSNLTDDINKSGPVGDFFTNTGQSFTDAYKAAPGSSQLKTSLFDPSRDRGPQALNRIFNGFAGMPQGRNPFNQEAGDIEYNRDMARRAAIVALAIGGGVAAGAYGAGSAAGGGATTTSYGLGAGGASVAPASTVGSTYAGAGLGGSNLGVTGLGGLGSAAPVAGSTAAYGVGAGNTAGLGVMGGAGSTGAAAPSVLGSGGYAGTSMGAEAAGAGLGGSQYGLTAGLGGAGTATAPAAPASSWAPYAMAGGSILSTLFSGLLQMERDKEARAQEIQMARARAAIENANMQNSALDRITQVWRR
jgi:hypothetical protein